MTTETLTEQVHLVNIISIAEDRLQTNFKTIMNKLRKHDQQIIDQSQFMKKMEQNIYGKIKQNEQINEKSNNYLNNRIEKCFELINSIKSKSKVNEGAINQCLQGINSNRNQLTEILNLFEQRNSQSKNQLMQLTDKLQQAQKDIYKAYEQILKKQDSTQVFKICKDVQGAKQKMDRYQKECKILEHKLQKIQIQNQKSQRNQIKKQSQLIRQIQDKIKRQLKNLQKSLPPSSGSRYSSPGITTAGLPYENIDAKSQQNQEDSKKDQTINQENLRLNFKMEEDEANIVSLKNNLQKISISKFNDRVQLFESRIKQIQSNMNNLVSVNKKTHKPENQQIKQKINQLKPELIKIWAKCDTLDDRILFNQRKAQDKAKLLNSLIQTQKQNSYARLDQKFKAFQTEMYAALKQLKMKVESKLNTNDYQKQSLILQERLKQITQLIYQKSDKIQVKKALLFLQSKIKQIILVISEDEENEKDALLTKKQLKCMSCDKDIDKVSKFATAGGKGNWDALPYKQHSPDILGKFGMSGFGSLSKKLMKIQSKNLPVVKTKKNANSVLQPIINTIPESDPHHQSK